MKAKRPRLRIGTSPISLGSATADPSRPVRTCSIVLNFLPPMSPAPFKVARRRGNNREVNVPALPVLREERLESEPGLAARRGQRPPHERCRRWQDRLRRVRITAVVTLRVPTCAWLREKAIGAGPNWENRTGGEDNSGPRAPQHRGAGRGNRIRCAGAWRGGGSAPPVRGGAGRRYPVHLFRRPRMVGGRRARARADGRVAVG